MFSIRCCKLGCVEKISVHVDPFSGFTIHSDAVDGAGAFACFHCEATASKFKKTILLLDNDSEGRKLLQRTQRLLSGRIRMDLYYQRALLPASKGKIRHIEELAPYAERLAVARI